MKTKLYRVRGEDADFLTDYPNDYAAEGYRVTLFRAGPPTLLARYLDQEAESANYHSLVGRHADILKLLEKHFGVYGPSRIRRFFEDLVDQGGLVP